MENPSVEIFVNRLREELRSARKSHDSIAMKTLQSLLARIDNAEAIPNTERNDESGNVFFAGAKSGLGSTETARKLLTPEDIRALIEDEILELQNTINDVAGQADESYPNILEKKIEILKTITDRSKKDHPARVT